MIPPLSMQTTKKHCSESSVRAAYAAPRHLFRAGRRLAGALHFLKPDLLRVVFPVLITLVLNAGCGPPGTQAILDGKKFFDRGEYTQAIEEFRAATELLPTNALAFNYLGLAFQQAGHVAEAERAYSRALVLNHDLVEIHYNLACLCLSQNKLEQAKSELTSYLMRQPNSADGWLRLGQAQLRSRELTASEKSLTEALKLAPQNPETLTSLGCLRWQRKRSNEAGQLFAKALKEQPDYAPALLNLAILAQQDMNDPRLALQRYREYLALKPAPENSAAVGLLVRQLNEELAPPAHETNTNVNVQASLPHTNTLKTVPTESGHTAVVSRATASYTAPPFSRTEPSTIAKSVSPTNLPKQTPVSNPVPAETLEVVKLSAEPVIKPAEDPTQPSLPAQTQSTDQWENSSVSPASNEAKTQKRGFLQRINPINLFAHDNKTSTGSPPQAAPLASQDRIDSSSVTRTAESSGSGESRKFPRYEYRSPPRPEPGDRNLAEQCFSQGVQAQQAHHLPEAIQAYRRAAQLDPAYFDAHYNLGLAAFNNGNFALALMAYETALAIEPESLDARYNFGLVLKQAGYVLDAVTQFERILSKYPNDDRTHLALGNLYAQQLQDPSTARQHYLAVLALAPQSPQAGAIRYWLSDHPK